MKFKNNTKSEISERIWWLLDHDLRIWASVMHVYKPGQLHFWVRLREWRDAEYVNHKEFVVSGIDAEKSHKLNVDKVSQDEILKWWRDVVLNFGVQWDEEGARAQVIYLQLLDDRADKLLREVQEIRRSLGQAAPFWMQVAADGLYCQNCQLKQAEMSSKGTQCRMVELLVDRAKSTLHALGKGKK